VSTISPAQSGPSPHHRRPTRAGRGQEADADPVNPMRPRLRTGVKNRSSTRCRGDTTSRQSIPRRQSMRSRSAGSTTRRVRHRVAFGVDGTLNEVANCLAGDRRSRLSPSSDLTNVVLPTRGIPTRRRRHRALIGLADDFRPRKIDPLGRCNAALRLRRRRRTRLDGRESRRRQPPPARPALGSGNYPGLRSRASTGNFQPGAPRL